jgi:tetratricopeptide (TPR) repeat protein
LASYKTLYKVLVSLGLSLFLTNCSVEKNTSSSRFYHSLTSRYNIYFNGYESFKAGLEKINKGYTDDYGDLLRVFEYSDPGTAPLCSSDMERAIQKASKVISLKSITAKPEIKTGGQVSENEQKFLDRKEYNEWVDDSYLLIAKARFYKHEFNESASILDYTITSANDPLIKTESEIWLARIYNETGNYSESSRLLNDIDQAALDNRSLKAMYHTTLADLFIKQKKYDEAAGALEKSMGTIKGKRTKYRLTYLQAQLYERLGNPAKAIKLYSDVVNMNPPYDIEFSARINIAGVFDINSGNPLEIRKELERMLRDSKNREFQDQIYFALGRLSMKEGKDKEALDFFGKSARADSRNQNQKGRSYLALADYYFNKSDYMNAGKYYDSSVFFLDQKYPEFMLLKTKSQNLNILVTQLKIIQTEDSLQKVAMMPEPQRNELIASIINDIVKAESEGKTSEYSDRNNLGQFYENERRFQNNIEKEGKWYFYNQTALTFGRTEFRRRWGDRKLEDNWRRGNKAKVTSSPGTSTSESGDQDNKDSARVLLDYKKPEYYLKNLPLNDSLLSVSNNKIANAYLNAGKAYSEKMSDNVKASGILENLITRFPSSDLTSEALFTLYKINKNDNIPKSETYRQKLLEKYPESEFAKILSDPEYYNKKLANLKLTEKLYQDAYDTYKSEKFEEAISRCNEALNKYDEDLLAPKFMLLKAYSVARISDERKFKEELNTLIKTWPLSEESKKAGEIIASINQKIPELKVEEDKQIAAELYVADTISAHLFALVITDPAFNINQAVFDVISYNIDNYTNKNYRTVGLLTDNRYIIINVSGFTNFKQVSDYYSGFSIEKIVRNQSGTKMYSVIISKENLNKLNNDKNPERYRLFFNENYLQQEKKK